MIIKTINDWGITKTYIYPFLTEETPIGLAASSRIVVYDGKVTYSGDVDQWTPEYFAQFTEAMQKAFELAGHQVEPVNTENADKNRVENETVSHSDND